MPLDYPLHERVLDNGLRVIVSPDHSVPTVTVNLWVNVGSRHETQGRTGFAHLFEHLMFQGSRNVAEGQHFSLLMGQGGRLNATTWFDRTNYFETVPTGALDLALWLESDRHGFLLDALTQENLDNQRDVVKEEKRQRYDNRPYGESLVHIYATVFPVGHPYHHPTIGSMADLDAASLQDVHDFFRRYYGPNNSVLTLVGDITPDDGFAAAATYFDRLPASAEAPRSPVAPLAPLTSPERLELVEDVPSDRIYLAFRLPVEGAEGYLAAELAFDILAGQSTSRLYRRLVRRGQLATSVSRSVMGLIDGVSLGFLAIDLAEGADLDDVEAQVLAELVELGSAPPTEVEMETAFAEIERWWLQSLASQEERADLISQFALLHDDPAYLNTYLDKVRAISPEQVQQAAATYLQPDNRAAVIYRKEASA